ncbi:hypothetical protein OEA41_009437 [Lepraria neglecta]|uniref:Uncharacterized protein n=1 Tax=Lepraria neglecta TaxID=209136 RepID=A0AAE0DGW2_9LECA|nr:hypothetical protein OEA41_009437 [Lepraria neglecta]
MDTKPSRLTAAALAEFVDPPKSQLSAWYKKPETHEQLAVGMKTYRSRKRTKEFLHEGTGPLRLTAAALAGLADPPKSQLDIWCEKSETHEQLAVELKTSRSEEKTKKSLDEVQVMMEDNSK